MVLPPASDRAGQRGARLLARHHQLGRWVRRAPSTVIVETSSSVVMLAKSVSVYPSRCRKQADLPFSTAAVLWQRPGAVFASGAHPSRLCSFGGGGANSWTSPDVRGPRKDSKQCPIRPGRRTLSAAHVRCVPVCSQARLCAPRVHPWRRRHAPRRDGRRHSYRRRRRPLRLPSPCMRPHAPARRVRELGRRDRLALGPPSTEGWPDGETLD